MSAALPNGPAPPQRRRRGMYVLPSIFTAANIGAGFFAILQTAEAVTSTSGATQHLDWAAMAILFAIPFDALDGRIARMTNTTSDFGRELDSLADVITFGVAPALLAFEWGFHSLPMSVNHALREHLLQLGGFVCFLYLICGSSRLARFNIGHHIAPKNPGRADRKYFVGMPIPAAAALLASTVHLCFGLPVLSWWISIIWLLIICTAGFLMVSTWRFWSGKEINLSRRQPFQLLILLAIVLYIGIRYSSVAVFLVALTYTFSGIWARAAYQWQRRRRKDAVLDARLAAMHEAFPHAYEAPIEHHPDLDPGLAPNPVTAPEHIAEYAPEPEHDHAPAPDYSWGNEPNEPGEPGSHQSTESVAPELPASEAPHNPPPPDLQR